MWRMRLYITARPSECLCKVTPAFQDGKPWQSARTHSGRRVCSQPLSPSRCFFPLALHRQNDTYGEAVSGALCLFEKQQEYRWQLF